MTNLTLLKINKTASEITSNKKSCEYIENLSIKSFLNIHVEKTRVKSI